MFRKFKDIKTLKELLDRNNEVRSDSTIFSYWNKERNQVVEVTVRKFKEDVDDLINYFIKNNIVNKKVAIISENSYEYFKYIFAIACSNNIAVLFDINLLKEEFIELLKFNDCEYIVHSNNYQEVVDNILAQYYLPTINMNELKVNHTLSVPNINIDPKDIALIIFTSGTSGERKGVMLSHQNIVYDAYYNDVNVIVNGSLYQALPLYHVFGIVVALSFVMAGCPIFICSSLRYLPKDILALDFDNFVVVPALLPIIHKCLKNKPLKQLRKIIVGGAGGAEKYYEDFNQLNTKLYFGYGMSETASCIAVDSDDCYLHDGSMKVLEGIEVKIDSPNEDGVGEIICRGPIVTSGYYKMPEKSSKLLRDGWLHSGDLGTLKNNRLRIVGRIKNLLVLPNGENIAPEIIEQKILLIKGVKECIVTINEGLLQANIYAPDVIEEEIREAIKKINENLNAHMRIANIVFRAEEFIKNSTGKIIRYNI